MKKVGKVNVAVDQGTGNGGHSAGEHLRHGRKKVILYSKEKSDTLVPVHCVLC